MFYVHSLSNYLTPAVRRTQPITIGKNLINPQAHLLRWSRGKQQQHDNRQDFLDIQYKEFL